MSKPIDRITLKGFKSIRPTKRGRNEVVRLEWQQKGSDFPFQPNHLSDGTMRFVCLATVLQQPDPPATIVIDEPELGLHPYAISILADLIKSAAERTQVIISTQSPTLLDYFEPGEIVVVSREQGQSTLDHAKYSSRMFSFTNSRRSRLRMSNRWPPLSPHCRAVQPKR